MKFENTETYGWESALRGMRNPMNSWNKADSKNMLLPNDYDRSKSHFEFVIGENDIKLCQSLIKAGSEHRKFLRQIFVSVDITAPMYFFSQFDTYKVGIVANSTSKMHKLVSTPITKDCFELGDFQNINPFEVFGRKGENSLYFETEGFLTYLEELRLAYLETKDKRYWKELIRWLPESWLQKRTVTMNYENVLNMYQQRCVHPHKLTEWSVDFANWVKSLPYAKEFLGAE